MKFIWEASSWLIYSLLLRLNSAKIVYIMLLGNFECREIDVAPLTLTFFKKSETAEFLMFLLSLVINLSMRIRFKVIYKNRYFFLHHPLACLFTVNSRLLRYLLVLT